ncbi:TetR family transcriptional regulator [Corynebacterium pseudodiphtheriticum]|uniref:TetR family transcriptional regulator n=1 Tax=Corynebacterium pseudodiphtheriticum TaxID=37637 RepID=UPI00254300AB|nr:TetR family transcriptional regulator [Corynebacterium pseudodiphtheriticum]MDK4206204.1 TetR family transcriptional regulator [Corynebacterium pseudodiphtheriticum]MDK8395407.1 TetR family transcriptional regulator [Corynebacterium pseudodiphtheriticum]
MQLHRETIISQALELLDTYGLADMTMRRVANSLGVAAGALYWHIANKQELITAVAKKILQPVFALVDAPPGSTYASPQDFCTTLHSTLLAHRDGAELVHAAVSQPHSPLWSHLCDSLVASIHHELGHNAPKKGHVAATHAADHAEAGAADHAEADVIATATSALHLVFGASIMEQSAQQLLAASNSAATKSASSNTDGSNANDGNGAGTTDVERGITVLLAGLQSRFHEQG